MFNFGIPRGVARNTEEKYNFPVITTEARSDDNPKAKWRFNLNGVAREKLGTNEGNQYVAFSFPEDRIVLKNVTTLNLPANVTARVTKEGSFTSKAYYKYILEKYDLNFNQDNEFKLILVTDEDEGDYFVMEYMPNADTRSDEEILDEAEAILTEGRDVARDEVEDTQEVSQQ